MGDIERVLNQKKTELEALKRKISFLESDIETLERASVIMSSEGGEEREQARPFLDFRPSG